MLSALFSRDLTDASGTIIQGFAGLRLCGCMFWVQGILDMFRASGLCRVLCLGDLRVGGVGPRPLKR